MSKIILGLDLGITSIGWALVKEAGSKEETSEIIKLGVRVNPLTVDEQTNFEKGKPISTNAERTLKRGARRNLQRYKLRRSNLIEILIQAGIITKETPLTEVGKNTTHQTLMLRAKAAHEKVDLEDFARILLTINKKRGYKSSRKTKGDEEGEAVDGMKIAKILYEDDLTPGQYVYKTLREGKKYIPDFYPSDLRNEIKRIWDKQSEYYPSQLTNDLFYAIEDKNIGQTYKILEEPWSLKGVKQSGNKDEQRLERYRWRQQALEEKLDLEQLVKVLQDINGELNKSSSYLGAISDRSKKLYFNKITVGEYLYNQIKKNPHTSLKRQVFYRQDYLDEFEQLWETQAKYYPDILTNELKTEIRDVIIFYQRKLKSQKGLISFCQFENKEVEYFDKEKGKTRTRTIGQRVTPRSSPIFQEFKIWQNMNNLIFENEETKEKIYVRKLDDEVRDEIFQKLNLRGNQKPRDIMKVISRHLYINKITDWKCNFDDIEGNSTNKALFNVYQEIATAEGHGYDWNKKSAQEIMEELEALFPMIGINKDVLHFDLESDSEDFDKQPAYQLWHLLYSAEDGGKASEEDRKVYGNIDTKLRKTLHKKYGFKPEYAKMLTNITLQQDYGNLSTKAMRKIIPYLRAGHPYAIGNENTDEIGACQLAGYNHSNSETTEDRKKKILKDRLETLPKNSLRNPVVEKILNQMVNLVNQVIEEYGKPDEVRIELARELKRTAKEREDMSKGIADATRRNQDIKNLIIKEFGIPNPTRNDVIRYRLWDELSDRGYKTIFTNKYIPKEKLFSKEIEIEHIIPKALLFDDSFSNKTLAYHQENQEKGNRTAFDYINQNYISKLSEYKQNVEAWYKNGSSSISKAKRNKLLMTSKNIPDEFIERDLRNTQYIAKKARQMLLEVFDNVVPTTGSITDSLRSDWGLINMMKELNLPKYRALGLTEYEERYDIGSEEMKKVEVIKDWTKRNDHRHHAVDALTVAFTTHNHIQYINYLNARRDENHKKHSIIHSIENVITERKNGSRVFKEPIPNFREVARKEIESILVSFKAKNKVVTNNINKTKLRGKKRYRKTVQTTPRGQLHKETVYGRSLRPIEKPLKLNRRFTLENAKLIIDKKEREAVVQHLSIYDNNSDKAFSTKTLKDDPILLNGESLKEVRCFEEIYTIRKPVNHELRLDKVIDDKVRKVLQNRLYEFNGNEREAFSSLEENPIWLNKEKGISIKRVTIMGVKNATSLHYKRDHLGKEIKDKNGKKIDTNFVQTGNNHHVAIYRDENGDLQEKVVSFFEAVERINQGLPVVDKSFNDYLGWEFLFTMKQNEMFVFHSNDFDPQNIDLTDTDNYSQISDHLFYVQSISVIKYENNTVRDFIFRHHLDSLKMKNPQLKNRSYFHIKSLSDERLNRCVKVRINHTGKIVKVGEY